MEKKSRWLQAGPASRCLKAGVFWAALCGISLMQVFALDSVPWWGRLGLILASVGLATVATIYFISYRVHKSRRPAPGTDSAP